jgi:ankyrin repeat protein
LFSDCTVKAQLICAGNSIEVASELIKGDKDINPRDHIGNTPWHHAAAEGQVDMLAFFLVEGCDAELRNNSGCTAVHLGSQAGECADELHLLF